MADDLDRRMSVDTLHGDTAAGQRKIRKGTKSCWECKRRKTRCIFPTSAEATCIGCQRRHVPCVGQDMPEAMSPARKGNQYLGERIARVEDVMKDLLASKDAGTPSQYEDELRQDGQQSRLDGLPVSLRGPPTPAQSPGEYVPSSSSLTSHSPSTSGSNEFETTALHPLLAAFPTEHDARLLLPESSRSSRYTGLINFQRHSKLTLETLAAPFPPAELPGPKTHPIIVVKCLLVFAITLQSPCEETLRGLSESPAILSRRLVAAATTWLTTHDQANGSLESLVCIILEAIFETNCGNLRRAWVVYRRAMTTAQMMGLHRSPTPPLKRVDPTLDADPEFVWFRIVYMDRYLSLLLGLPQGTSDKGMAASSLLRHEPPLGQFERMLTVVASYILERNENAFATSEISTTQFIDSELLKVSKSMPTSFWRPANFQYLVPGSPENLLETVRLAAQVYYYGLLIQVHLPYMMHGVGSNTEHEYSRITCVNASREILTRFIAHRSFNPKTSCSRPVDFFALLAAMTLLLAHLDAHHYRDSTNFLAHQRLSDRAMLDQALERMDIISNVDKDTVSEKSAKWIRQLLDIEADAAGGSTYTASSVRREDDDSLEGIERRCEELRLHIPYLGVIKIARQGLVTREPSKDIAFSRPQPPLRQPTQSDYSQQHTAQLTNPNAAYVSMPTVDDPQSLNNHLHRSISSPNSNSTFSTDHPHMAANNAAHLQMSGYDQQCMLQYGGPSHDNMGNPLQTHTHAQMDVCGIDVGIDDWAFQGVDMAFFDSLMRGTACVDPNGMEQ